jgi:hypothetical protein
MTDDYQKGFEDGLKAGLARYKITEWYKRGKRKFKPIKKKEPTQKKLF